MKDGPLWFPVVLNKNIAFSHHLEVGISPSNFIFVSVPGPFLRADEELGRSREVVDLFKSKIVNFTCAVFQVHDEGTYIPLGLMIYPIPLTYVLSPFSRGVEYV